MSSSKIECGKAEDEEKEGVAEEGGGDLFPRLRAVEVSFWLKAFWRHLHKKSFDAPGLLFFAVNTV